MKLFNCISFCLLTERVPYVLAIPTFGARSLGPLDALTDVLPAAEDTATPPSGNIAPGAASALPAVESVAQGLGTPSPVDVTKPIPLDALKGTPKGLRERTQDVAGHPLPPELLAALSLLETGNHTKAKRNTFDANAQLIDVTGEHAFVPPNFRKGDVRGPCPGLNVLANHGYMPHNGVGSILEYVTATNKVFGMGLELSTLLAIYGTVLGGNPLSLKPGVSMGGPSPASQNLLGNLGGLLGKPRGLSGTHNQFEVDSSIVRSDLYSPVNGGNNEDVFMPYFMDLYNLQKDAEEPNFTPEVMFQHAHNRHYQSVATNPNFVKGPFTGWYIRNAPYLFTARLMANRSAEHPVDGILDKETLKSFYGVYGPEHKMVYKEGWDRIPDNWYRRSDEYSFLDVTTDIITYTSKDPVLLSIGGNVNGVNTFSGIDFADITGSPFTASQLLEGNNFICFAMQSLRAGAPNSLGTLYATIGPALERLLGIVDKTMLSLNCPAFRDLSVGGTNLLDYMKSTYPGAARSKGVL